MVAFLRRVGQNWKLKTLAVALAVLLWIVVSSEQVTTGWITLPLVVRVADENYRVDPTSLPATVEVRLSGPAKDLFGLVLRKPPLILPVTGVENQVETRDLDPGMVQLPAQIAVDALEVSPASLTLQFARVDTRVVPVRTQLNDRLGEGWVIVDSLRIAPSVVELSGPAEGVAAVTEILTRPFELTPADTIVDRTIALDTAGLRGFQLSVGSVRVTGRVERVLEQTMPDMPVDVGPGIAILPDRVDVTLRGAESAVRSMAVGSLRIVVSITQVPTQIPPDGLLVPVGVDGLRPGLTARLSPGEVRLFPAGVVPDSVATAESGPSRDAGAAPEPLGRE